ncbi:uncharacterized protein LOC133197066 [Saccostrea echinata]|uniref:uncharacterized protein LOC133197066 n=1 Tax=Saccostrea echinata TaxID=191078 RepID=UPI002A83EBE4|nr:uncharacterized protein LOC133197066 [Saccostrea echinata]
MYSIFIINSGIIAGKVSKPLYVWPLGDKSGLLEVLSNGPSLVSNGNQCFKFGENVKSIPYQAIGIGDPSNPHLSVVLDEPNSFRDLGISMYVKPDGKPKGTLLQYKSESAEKIRIVFDPYDGFAVISFRDEYDIPAGIVVADNLAPADSWTHIFIQRSYKTGRITVYANDRKVVDEDDEFQDEISLPASGHLRIGNTEPPDSDGDQQFKGVVSCLQIFTENVKPVDVKSVSNFCLPDEWNLGSQVYFGPEEKATGTRCKTDPPESTSTIPSPNQPLTMTHLVNERKWEQVRTRFHWKNSKKDNVYFRLYDHNIAPVPVTANISKVNTADLKTCARLCLRVYGCVSFAFTSTGSDIRKCSLFDIMPTKFETKQGVKFFTVST